MIPDEDYRAWYIEAMQASNEAGFAGLSAAETIRMQAHYIAEMRAKLNEVNAWIVCAAITTPEDMMQNALRIEEITRPV